MTALAVTGWAVLSSRGEGAATLTAALAAGGSPEDAGVVDVTGMYPEPLPTRTGHALAAFDVRTYLGRKGTTFLDRRSALAVVACGLALTESGLCVTPESAQRVGIALGTTWGSLKSMSDYTKESLLADRPYLVDPFLFPNTVMNCAAGQAAIRYGLKGVNATLAGGPLAFLNVLAYVSNVMRCGYADAMLAGAVEEFTPHTAWATSLVNAHQHPSTAGEGAAVFVLQPAALADAVCARRDAEILSVVTGFAPGGASGGQLSRGLESCLRQALTRAAVEPRDLAMIALCGDDGARQARWDALAGVIGDAPAREVAVRRITGECQAASGAMEMAMLLAMYAEDPRLDGRPAAIVDWTDAGGVGAAVIRGWSRR